MKERHGFVSNSSSSSFIVYGAERTTSQIMREMLKLVKKEHKTEKAPRKYILGITKAITWLSHHPKYDKPLLYPGTCNYETWIIRDPKTDDIVIHTCNNHDCNWESMDGFAPSDCEDYDILKGVEFLDLSDMKKKTYEKYNEEYEALFAKMFDKK